MLTQALKQTSFLFEEFSEGRPSLVESGFLEDREEKGNIEGGDVEKILEWPLKLSLVPH